MKANRAREQTRTEETIACYLNRADGLLSRIAEEMLLSEDVYPPPDAVLTYLKDHAKEWKWSTFRQYQASLACRYEREYARSHHPLFASTAAAIRDLSHRSCQPENTPGRTSSRKRKGIPQRDYDVLVANLSHPKQNGAYAKRAALWLMSALATGLRPCEWQRAEFNEDGTMLIVQNAKATNGRATGKYRLVPVQAEDLEIVRAHLESIHHLLRQALTFHQIHKRCGEALNRACRALWGENISKCYSLYSARHQFGANRKAIASKQEVAALLGHCSTRTARRHYAPRRAAWSAFKDKNKWEFEHRVMLKRIS